MKLYLFLAVLTGILAAAFFPVPAEAGGVVIVTRKDTPAFDEVKNSFLQQSYVSQTAGIVNQAFYLDGGAGDTALLKGIADKTPDVVFAVGYYAAKKVREAMADVTIVAAMVYYPEMDGMNLDPKTVVISSLGPPRELMIQAKQFRKIKTVGLLHSSTISSSADSIAAELRTQGVEVVDLPIAKQEDISAVFEGAKGRMQAVVILPESLTLNPDVIRFMVTQSVSNDILPLSFSENMVSSGIFFSVFYPTDGIGKKSAQIVKEIVASQKIPAVRVQVPETSNSALNRGGLQAFKLKIPSNMKIGVTYE
jgi:ABC-type uncharacterized transport system substrate-binding protein